MIVSKLIKIVATYPIVRVSGKDGLVWQSSQKLDTNAFPCVEKITINVLLSLTQTFHETIHLVNYEKTYRPNSKILVKKIDPIIQYSLARD
jgi:hypothetical protein